jgi:hypothetical protein
MMRIGRFVPVGTIRAHAAASIVVHARQELSIRWIVPAEKNAHPPFGFSRPHFA